MTTPQLAFAGGFAATMLFITYLLLEKLSLKLARKRYRVVIHVNGTRGKSTVTRMVHAVLREAGYNAWGKTTGTEPRLLLPDGTERLIRRIAPANVREQRNMALRAALAGADALVFECNAIRPELQLVSSAYIQPDLVVITNARLDHRPEQGSADEAARAFAATIPAGGTVATSDIIHRELWKAAAAGRGARCLFVDPAEGAGLGDLPENAACALAVADWLGLPRERASSAMQSYHPDPGAFRLLSWDNPGGGRTWFADASAANDPESTDRLAGLALERATAEGMNISEQENRPAASRILVIANRPDRPDRALLFAGYAMARITGAKGRESADGEQSAAKHSCPVRYDEVVFLGSLPLKALRSLRISGIKRSSRISSGCIGSGPGYRFIRRPENLLCGKPGSVSRGSNESAYGDYFIIAAGNRGGPGKALHAWALSMAGKKAGA
jgi:poly-gamma-glutamate synthase PgsB/CapB